MTDRWSTYCAGVGTGLSLMTRYACRKRDNRNVKARNAKPSNHQMHRGSSEHDRLLRFNRKENASFPRDRALRPCNRLEIALSRRHARNRRKTNVTIVGISIIFSPSPLWIDCFALKIIRLLRNFVFESNVRCSETITKGCFKESPRCVLKISLIREIAIGTWSNFRPGKNSLRST